MNRLLNSIILLSCCWLASGAMARAQDANAGLETALNEARTLFNEAKPQAALQRLQACTPPPTAVLDAALALKLATIKGLAHFQAGAAQPAIQHLTPVLEQLKGDSPARREVVQAIALSHYLLGHLPEALPLLEQVASWSSNNEYIYALGLTAIQTRQPEKARAAFARMYGASADSAAAHLLTAQMMVRVEFEEFAETELKQALSKDPKLPQAHYLLGQIAIYKGRVEEGAAFMQREIAVNPGNANAYYKLGDAYTRLTKWDEAIAALQKSVWLNPYFSGPYILLGKSYLKKREPTNAEGMLKRAIQFDPNNKSAHYMLAQVYQQSGRAEDAKREFAIAEKLQGDAEKPER